MFKERILGLESVPRAAPAKIYRRGTSQKELSPQAQVRQATDKTPLRIKIEAPISIMTTGTANGRVGAGFQPSNFTPQIRSRSTPLKHAASATKTTR
jgi:hypothetical protein